MIRAARTRALYVLLGLAIAAGVWSWFARRPEPLTEAELRIVHTQGFREVRRGRPELPAELPPSLEPVAEYRGRIEPSPEPPSWLDFPSSEQPDAERLEPEPGESVPPPAIVAPEPPPPACVLRPEDLSGDCATLLVEAPDGTEFARILWTGAARVWTSPTDYFEVSRGPEIAEDVSLISSRAGYVRSWSVFGESGVGQLSRSDATLYGALTASWRLERRLQPFVRVRYDLTQPDELEDGSGLRLEAGVRIPLLGRR